MEQKEKIKQMAKVKLAEEHDDVKTMNKMMLYSKCVTIRDQQKEEKKKFVHDKKEEDRRLDLIMEIERLKSLKHQEEIETKKLKDQRHGALVIQKQIEERQRQQKKLEEEREREKQEALQKIKELQDEEIKQQIEKKEQ